jgi:hypothetical protein
LKQKTYIITFPDTSLAEANGYASALAIALRDLDPSLSAEQCRDRTDTQDFGATVAIVLGTASVTAVANGIATWLARNSGAKIRIDADGTVMANHLDSKDASKIAKAFSKHM